MLAKEQYIGAAALLVIAVAAWVFVITHGEKRDGALNNEEANGEWARLDSLRKDSVERVRARRDSLREARWEHIKDSFRQIDDARFAQWTEERQQRYDSFHIADSLWRDSVGWRYIKHEKKDTVLDLNKADTTELMLIRGIGRYKAQRIVRYREQLGGFYSPEQLCDEALRDLRLDSVVRCFIASPEDIRKIAVNHCGTETLSKHPYLRFNQAKAIYQLRRKYIRIERIEDLEILPELDKNDINRIKFYLSFDN